MHRHKATVLFTCCGGAGGWSLLRSLAACGYRLVGVDTDPLVPSLYQDDLAAGYVVPRGEEEDYVDRILAICRDEGVDVMWPASDEEVIACSARADEFRAAGIALVASRHEVVMAATDKLGTVNRLDRIGIPVPNSWRLDQPPPAPPMPVIVRPIRGRSGHGVQFFGDTETLEAYSARLGREAAEHFAQEKLEFHLGRLYMAQAVFDGSGALKARFMSRSIRTMHSWGGPALGGVPVESKRLWELASKVFEETGPHFGAVNAEFIHDPRHEDFVFLEVNPRYWGYSYLATAAGINFPDITVRTVLGEKVEPQIEFSTEVVTMTSREQIAVPRSRLLGELPPGAEG